MERTKPVVLVPLRPLAAAMVLLALALAAPADAAPRRSRHKKPKPVPAEPAPAATPAPGPDDAAPDEAPDAGAPVAKPATAPATPAPPAKPTTTAAPGAPVPPPGAPVPPPAPSTPRPGDAGADTADVDSLRQEYLTLRDELFQSRARAATVASALYSTQVSIKLTYTSGRFYNVTRAAVRLDGASVFDDTEGAIGRDDAVRFTGWIAPGRHLLTVRVEATGKDDDRFTTATETTVVVQAVAGKDLVINARAHDGGDLPYAWKRKESGGYRLGLDVDVKSQARPKPASGKS